MVLNRFPAKPRARDRYNFQVRRLGLQTKSIALTDNQFTVISLLSFYIYLYISYSPNFQQLWQVTRASADLELSWPGHNPLDRAVVFATVSNMLLATARCLLVVLVLVICAVTSPRQGTATGRIWGLSMAESP